MTPDELRISVRHLARRGLRAVALTATPQLYPSAPVARTYWWTGVKNFGDLITPQLLASGGIMPASADENHALVFAVGSILEHIPTSRPALVWGSGLLLGQPHQLDDVTYFAVRGALTRDLQEIQPTVPLGDPGLLVAERARRRRPRFRLGIVPHYDHRLLPTIRELGAAPGAVVVDVMREPDAVIRDIAECEAIVSTSLHGLIVADALGIPALWAQPEPALKGGTFKFHDYLTALGEPGDARRAALEGATVATLETAARTADGHSVRRVQDDLRAARRRLRDDLVIRFGARFPLPWRTHG